MIVGSQTTTRNGLLNITDIDTYMTAFLSSHVREQDEKRQEHAQSLTAPLSACTGRILRLPVHNDRCLLTKPSQVGIYNLEHPHSTASQYNSPLSQRSLLYIHPHLSSCPLNRPRLTIQPTAKQPTTCSPTVSFPQSSRLPSM